MTISSAFAFQIIQNVTPRRHTKVAGEAATLGIVLLGPFTQLEDHFDRSIFKHDLIDATDEATTQRIDKWRKAALGELGWRSWVAPEQALVKRSISIPACADVPLARPGLHRPTPN